jgi:hypothetical protein
LHFSTKYTIPALVLVTLCVCAPDFTEGDKTMTVKQTQPTVQQQTAMHASISKQMANILVGDVDRLLVGMAVSDRAGRWLWPVSGTTWPSAK